MMTLLQELSWWLCLACFVRVMHQTSVGRFVPSPNCSPGKITTLRNEQIKEIVCNMSGVEDANTTGMLSGVRPPNKATVVLQSVNDTCYKGLTTSQVVVPIDVYIYIYTYDGRTSRKDALVI